MRPKVRSLQSALIHLNFLGFSYTWPMGSLLACDRLVRRGVLAAGVGFGTEGSGGGGAKGDVIDEDSKCEFCIAGFGLALKSELI